MAVPEEHGYLRAVGTTNTDTATDISHKYSTEGEAEWKLSRGMKSGSTVLTKI
jgi:hypothetical protein